jgi:hypothetical protein
MNVQLNWTIAMTMPHVQTTTVHLNVNAMTVMKAVASKETVMVGEHSK